MISLPKTRYLRHSVASELNEKMVLIGGPRQVGKTTLALSFLDPPSLENSGYLNWDFVKDRKILTRGELPQKKIIVLDEVHKFRNWRNLVKGFYDKLRHRTAFIVTGSARLDHYRKGGDSLFGRFRYFRLHPFTLSEVNSTPSASDLEQLLHFGGFPEPLTKANERNLRLWQAERLERVIKDDLRDLENVREISLIQLLVEALAERVGSPLSIKNLREDLDVAHESVERWVTILENLYVCYRIAPFGSTKIRAVKKEKKLYLWDYSSVPMEGGFRFENLVASHLLKYCHFVQDTEGYKMELRFIRDTDKREVDFVVLKDSKPIFAVETKTGEKSVSPSLNYFSTRLTIPKFFQVHMGKRDYIDSRSGVRVLPFGTFCQEMSLV